MGSRLFSVLSRNATECGSRTGMGSRTFTELSHNATECGSRTGMGSRTFTGLSRNATEVFLGCSPLRCSGSGSAIQGRSDLGTSKELFVGNPFSPSNDNFRITIN